MLRPRLCHRQLADAIEVLVLDCDIPAPPRFVQLLPGDMLHDILPCSRAEFWIGAVEIHARQLQVHVSLTLQLARVYLNGADPKLGTRTWQDVMEHIVSQKTDETRRRWETAIKDKDR